MQAFLKKREIQKQHRHHQATGISNTQRLVTQIEMLKVVLVLVHRRSSDRRRERSKHQEEVDEYVSNTGTLDGYFQAGAAAKNVPKKHVNLWIGWGGISKPKTVDPISNSERGCERLPTVLTYIYRYS